MIELCLNDQSKSSDVKVEVHVLECAAQRSCFGLQWKLGGKAYVAMVKIYIYMHGRYVDEQNQ